MSRLASSPKSQAAIFIIIALMIILSGVLYFFYQRQSVEQEIEIIQPEAAPVKLYVEDCIKAAAEDGLERIGLSGGYIEVPESIGNDKSAYLSEFENGFKMPYWWHEGIESVPTEEFMVQQLSSHIQSGMKSCINGFGPFAEKFQINGLAEPIASVQLNENDVSVKLKYPLEIASHDGTFRQLMQNFDYTVPVRLKKVYELAKTIMERENNEYFLEKKTIDLYSMDTDIPTTDVEAMCGPRTWRLADIRDKLMTLLRVNIPYIRIKGTDYNANIYVPNPSGKSVYSQTYFQQHYVWELEKDEKIYRNMKVSFSYNDWPLEIYARPSQDGILRSNSQKGTDMLSFFCLHIWHFTYDIGYPVVATILDQETDRNKAYQFRFAFRVSIDHNQPSRIPRGATLFETEADISSQEYCNDERNEVTIYTVDNSTGNGIRDVNLTFVCGRFYCDAGASNWLGFGGSAGITKRFPSCVNAVIKAAKPGYSESKSFIQTDVDGRSYVVSLSPIKEFANYRVVKHSLSSAGSSYELLPNEKASILVKSKDNSYEGFAVYPKEAEFPLRIPDKDAAYEVSVYLVDDENIIGGYIGDWKVTKESLRKSSEIVFHVIEQGPASDDERALFISGLGSYSKSIPAPELR